VANPRDAFVVAVRIRSNAADGNERCAIDDAEEIRSRGVEGYVTGENFSQKSSEKPETLGFAFDRK
jgi:hypothetical protein